MLGRCSPGVLIYRAGADSHEGDCLGRLRLTMQGLAERDRMVFDVARTHGIPLAVTMAGGYGHAIEQMVDVHCQTVLLAAHLYQRLNMERSAAGHYCAYSGSPRLCWLRDKSLTPRESTNVRTTSVFGCARPADATITGSKFHLMKNRVNLL